MKKVFIYTIILFVSFANTLFAQENSRKNYSSQDFSKTHFQNPFTKYDQKPVFVHVGGGTMYYWGDLVDGFVPKFLRPSTNIGVSYYFSPQLSIRATYTHGTITADDVVSAYDSHRARNLHFRSRIDELSFVFVYEIFQNQYLNSRYFNKMGKIFSPYIFAGGALFHFNPQAKFNGNWIDLQPLGTEGQFIPKTTGETKKAGRSYSLWNLSIPFGAGVKFNCTELITFSFEAGMRKTFTDYLDDASTTFPDLNELAKTPDGETAVIMSDRVDETILEGVKGTGAPRGNPKYKDYYFDFALSVSYYINRKFGSK